jgi:RNA polymerase sigma factor (sigma-70 family)
MDPSEAVVNPAVRYVRRAALRAGGAALTDGQLLARFVRQRDEAAFETLVRRHGPMVGGVCRRVLRDGADADDAFQATFLVLARKAAVIRDPARLANWLYGVAARTAQKARALTLRRRAREVPMAVLPDSPADTPEAGWDDWLPLLDQELARLPEKYRVPVVFCDLQGLTQKAAAKQLGWPEGTVSSRLSRGRALLAARLARYKGPVSAAMLAAALAEIGAARVRAALVGTTVNAALGGAAGVVVSAQVTALTEGVMKAMLLSRLKIAIGAPLAVVVAVAILGLGADALRGGRPEAVAAPAPAPAAGAARWEYKAMTRREIEDRAPQDAADKLVAGLNALGDKGWELAAIEPAAGGFGAININAVPAVPPGGGLPVPAVPAIPLVPAVPAGPPPGNAPVGEDNPAPPPVAPPPAAAGGGVMVQAVNGVARLADPAMGGRYLFKRPK